MSDMTPAELHTLAATDPEAATAIATVSMAEATTALVNATSSLVDVASALVDVTIALLVVGLFIGLLQVGVVWHGIRKMVEAGKQRDERFQKSMDAEADRHKEAMEALAAERAESGRRHQEAMQADERRHEHAMKALDALIRNTAPGPAPAA